MEPLSLVGLCAAAGLGYCLCEARCYIVRNMSVSGPAAHAGLRILHVSDLHLAPWDMDRVRWLSRLDSLAPDMVIASGDFLAHPRAVPLVRQALAPLLELPGAFVLGSNDYFAPRFKNPFAYLGRNRRRVHGAALPTQALRDVLSAGGWLNLDNSRGELSVRGATIELRGTGDAHIDLDDYAQVAGPWQTTATLRLSVTHAPYSRVLTAMAKDAPDLILAGHTHGGQITVPFVTALTTNCDLPVKQARGLSFIPGPAGDIALHVSAGVGTSPIFPVRLGCRPEATLLTLTA